ncbi:Thrombospondin type-1 domain-containing protein [Trichinella pseudospiralis]
MAYCSGEVDSVIERGERKYCARSVINRNYINEQPGPFQASEKHVLWTRSNLLKPLLGFSFHNVLFKH